jgi:hypothetical protein
MKAVSIEGSRSVHFLWIPVSTPVLVLKYEYELICQEKSTFCKFISKQRIISLRHSSILRKMWLNFMAICLVFIWRFFQFSHFCFWISNFFDLSITEENWVVEMRTWCIEIGNILILHANEMIQVEISAVLCRGQVHCAGGQLSTVWRHQMH